MNQEVFAEADRAELISVINDITKVSKKEIEAVLTAFPQAVAMLLKFSEPLEDGSKRAEIHNIGIFRLKKQAASVGVGISAGVEIAEHMTLKIKAHKGLLDAVSDQFELETKNR